MRKAYISWVFNYPTNCKLRVVLKDHKYKSKWETFDVITSTNINIKVHHASLLRHDLTCCEPYQWHGRDTYLQCNVRHLLSLKQCVGKRVDIRIEYPNMIFEMAMKYHMKTHSSNGNNTLRVQFFLSGQHFRRKWRLNVGANDIALL